VKKRYLQIRWEQITTGTQCEWTEKYNRIAEEGSALPDNEVSGQLNPEPTAIYVLDAGYHHPGDGVKPELMPHDTEGTIYTKKFIPERIDGHRRYNTYHKKCCSHRTASIGLFHDQVYVNGWVQSPEKL
jgi:hypothetical protein